MYWLCFPRWNNAKQVLYQGHKETKPRSPQPLCGVAGVGQAARSPSAHAVAAFHPVANRLLNFFPLGCREHTLECSSEKGYG